MDNTNGNALFEVPTAGTPLYMTDQQFMFQSELTFVPGTVRSPLFQPLATVRSKRLRPAVRGGNGPAVGL
jgi:hypothetical protein